MVKTLTSILNTMPPATVNSQTVSKSALNNKNLLKISRLNCEVPLEIKQQIKQYIANHPGETEKTIIMKALKNFGFSINEIYLQDKRSNNS